MNFLGEPRSQRLKLHLKLVANGCQFRVYVAQVKFTKARVLFQFEHWEICDFVRLGEEKHSIIVYRIRIGAKSLFPAPNKNRNLCQISLQGYPPLIKTDAIYNVYQIPPVIIGDFPDIPPVDS